MADQRIIETSTSASEPRKPIFELISDPKATQTLPSLGVIVQELAQMMSRPTTPLHGISALIRRDQSMSVRILRLANSAYFAPTEPVLNVEQALLYLGLNQIRSSILTAKCIEQTCHVPQGIISWKQFWEHAVGVGCVSRLLASHLKDPQYNGETYYMMGLLHDIGKLVLASLSPEDFEKTVTVAQSTKSGLSSVEFDLLGIDHCELGAWYLRQQALPDFIAQAVRLHHSWQSQETVFLPACTVSLANIFAHGMSFGISGSWHDELENPYNGAEWRHYSKECGAENEDADAELQALVDREIGQLRALVDQLTA